MKGRILRNFVLYFTVGLKKFLYKSMMGPKTRNFVPFPICGTKKLKTSSPQ